MRQATRAGNTNDGPVSRPRARPESIVVLPSRPYSVDLVLRRAGYIAFP